MRKKASGGFGKFNEPASDRSSRFNPPMPPSGKVPTAYKKPKTGIDPDAFSDDKSARFNPKTR